jgi:hypothetical protein
MLQTEPTNQVDNALQVIRNKLHNDDSLAGRSLLRVEAIMELLEVCLRTTYFQVDGKFFQQNDGMTMENCRPSLATSSWSLLRFGF